MRLNNVVFCNNVAILNTESVIDFAAAADNDLVACGATYAS